MFTIRQIGYLGKLVLPRGAVDMAANLPPTDVELLAPMATLVVREDTRPALNWRVKSRIYKRYGELKFIEAELEADPAKQTRAEWMKRVDAIERDVNHLTMPLAFSDMIYTLRSHIGLVREAIEKKATVA